MKLVFCCKEMRENMDACIVEYNTADGNFIIALPSVDVVLDYCPFCGKKTEVNDI